LQLAFQPDIAESDHRQRRRWPQLLAAYSAVGNRASAPAVCCATHAPHAESDCGGAGGGRAGAVAATGASQPAAIQPPSFTDASHLERDWTVDDSGTWAITDGLLGLVKAGTPARAIRRPSALLNPQG